MSPVESESNVVPTCQGPECTDPAYKDDLCRPHYRQKRRGGPLKPKRTVKPREGTCEVRDCPNPVRTDGKCVTHYRRWSAGEPDWARPIRNYAGYRAGTITKEGSRVVSVGGRRVPEHIMLAEQMLGRALLPGEKVYHLNGDRLDNRVEGPFRLDEQGRLVSGNLGVRRSGVRRSGQEIGPQLAEAMELLRTYGTPEQRKWVAGQAVGVDYEVPSAHK